MHDGVRGTNSRLGTSLPVSVSLLSSNTTKRKVDIAMKGLKVSCLLVLLAFLSTSAFLLAQSDNGSIQGTITDSTGAVVSGATIDVTSLATAQTITATSGG